MTLFTTTPLMNVFQKLLLLSCRFVIWFYLFSISLPIILYMYMGRYVRYFADDFGTASNVLTQGFWQAQLSRYLTWTGSYTNSFLIYSVELGGVNIVQWLPGLAMTCWVILFVVWLKLILKGLEIEISNHWIGILSITVIFCTIRSFRDYSQVIFWQTGIVAYLSNILVFLLITIYFLSRFWKLEFHPTPLWKHGLLLTLVFIAGGISETWVVMQIALFGLALMTFFFLRNRLSYDAGLRPRLIGSFLASLLSLFVTLISPGNAYHAESMEELSVTRIAHYLLVSLVDVPSFLSEWVQDYTLVFALLAVTAFLCGIRSARGIEQKRSKINLQLLIGAYMFANACLILWMGLFPAFLVFGSRPPDRAIFTAMFIFLCGFVMLTLLAGRAVGYYLDPTCRTKLEYPLMVCLIVLIILSPIRTAASQVRLFPALRVYAQLWDERDAILRNASQSGETDVIVQSLRRNNALKDLRHTIWLVGELEENPNNWKNMLAAKYYGLKSITGQK